jgi:hypothetical protein
MRALVATIVLVVAPAAAQAYPQFVLSMGPHRCASCHYSPTGGGLINGYGRDKAGDSISTWSSDGGFLHGLWKPPEWLALGADLRGAGFVSNENAKTGTDDGVFPMQADLYGRLAVGQLSLNVIGGFRGSTDRRNGVPPFASRLFSREHYLLWRQGAEGFYLRAGRFFAPYGLNLAEHTTYVRRFLGFNTLEETYNLTAGYFGHDWELHVSAFTPDFWRDAVGERGSGGAASFRRNLGDSIIWGAQARVIAGDEDTREMGGLMAVKYLAGARLQVMAEADLVHQSFKSDDYTTWQFVGYLGGAWFPVKGLMTQLTFERWDEDLKVKGVARDAFGLSVQWFPIAHVEVAAYGRYQVMASGDPLKLALLQIHYYL